MAKTLRFAAPCSRGTEPMLAAELRRLGIHRVKEGPGVVTFHGDLKLGYRAVLWSRVASRVLLELDRFDAPTADQLYAGVSQIDWSLHLERHNSFAVGFTGRSKHIRHTGFGAQRTKDAIVDALRTSSGQRPSVDREDPDLRVQVHLQNGVASVSLDLAGRPLHQRGEPGRAPVAAPLKETLAAAILLFADWPRQSKRGAPLVDPMCGSGTFLAEAAGMALDRAANLERRRWGFSGWRGHDAEVWKAEHQAAQARWEKGRTQPVSILGLDLDRRAVRAARNNCHANGVLEAVRVEPGDFATLEPPDGADAPPRGVMVVNPPYGERLGEEDDLLALYGEIGDLLRRRLFGWTGYVFTSSHRLASQVGLRARRRIPLWNGRLDCRLLEYPIDDMPPLGGGPGWR